MSGTRRILLMVLGAALLAALGLLYWGSLSDTAYVTTQPLARYQQITDADLQPVQVARNRPAGFSVLTSQSDVVGKYAAQELPAGSLLVPPMVVDAPPALRVFATGKELPEGMRGYALTVSSDLAPLLRDSDQVDLVLLNPLNGTATWLLSGVEPLAIVQQENGPQSYLLALTPQDVAMVEGALADARVEQSGAYVRLVLSQAQNPPPGEVQYSYRDLLPGSR
jgi:hypothetical protein